MGRRPRHRARLHPDLARDWLNLIECQFQALRSFALNGSDYPSHADQDAAIRADLRWHNRNARPAKPWRLNAEVHHSLPNVAA